MSLVFLSKAVDPTEWRAALLALMPELDFRVWPEVGDPAEVECVLVWRAPPGDLLRYPNLKLIHTFGAGADQLLADPTLPPAVPIVRIVDANQTAGMVEYVAWAVLRYHRRLDLYASFQARREWRRLPHIDAGERRVGVMGLGVLGRAVAQTLARFGFRMAGWSRRPKEISGIDCFHGAEGFKPFLVRSDILACLLPLTPETENLIDRDCLAALPRGAALISAGRGRQVVEADLLAALDSGHLHGATLDVFVDEPLPAEHPFWRHPRVTITPHIATLPSPRSAAMQVVDNLRRARAGEPLLNVVDRRVGY